MKLHSLHHIFKTLIYTIKQCNWVTRLLPDVIFIIRHAYIYTPLLVFITLDDMKPENLKEIRIRTYSA